MEKIKIPSLSLQHPAPLSLLASGKTKGIVFDIGHGITSCVGVLDHQIIQSSFSAIGTQTLMNRMADALEKQGCTMSQYDKVGIPIDLLHNKRICVKVNEDKKDNEILSYELPDGQIVEIQNLRDCAEFFFDSKEGLQNLLIQSENPLMETLLPHCCVVGRLASISGLQERLEKELLKLDPLLHHYEGVREDSISFLHQLPGESN